MISFEGLMRETGRPGDWKDAMADIRAQQGKGASRWVSEKFGVSMRTAQRWLKSEQTPGGRPGTTPAKAAERRVIGAVDPLKGAARNLRTATRIELPEIDIRFSKGVGKRKPDMSVPVTGGIRTRLDRIADLIDRGNLSKAEEDFGKLALDIYFTKGKATDGRHIQSDMSIEAYGSGTSILGR